MLYRYVATAYSNCFLSSLQVSLFSQNKGYFEKKIVYQHKYYLIQ